MKKVSAPSLKSMDQKKKCFTWLSLVTLAKTWAMNQSRALMVLLLSRWSYGVWRRIFDHWWVYDTIIQCSTRFLRYCLEDEGWTILPSPFVVSNIHILHILQYEEPSSHVTTIVVSSIGDSGVRLHITHVVSPVRPD